MAFVVVLVAGVVVTLYQTLAGGDLSRTKLLTKRMPGSYLSECSQFLLDNEYQEQVVVEDARLFLIWK